MNIALYKNRSVGFVQEAENGVPVSSVGADGYGLELTEISASTEAEQIEKTVFKASISPGPGRVGKVPASVSIAGELKNSGVPNRKPKIDAVLQAARFQSEPVLKMTVSGTAAPGTIKPGKTIISAYNAKGLVVGLDNDANAIYYVARSETPFKAGDNLFDASLQVASLDGPAGFLYRPKSDQDSQKTYTLAVNDGGLKKWVYGSVCTFSLELTTESYPSFTAEFTGIASKDDWGVPSQPLPTGIAWEDHQPAIVKDACVRIGADYAPITSSISVDAGNETYLIPDLNSETWLKFAVVTSRNGTATMAVTADIEQSASLYQKLFAGEVASMSFRIGGGSGNQIDVLLPAVQYTGIAESDQNSLLGQELNLKLTGEDDEVMLWFR